LLAALENQVKIHAGVTTPDGQFSLLTARCLGSCGIAPVMVFDGVVAGEQTPETALSHPKEWLTHGSR
jgi:bidirectional [NiFe] hydrogenase diaphorase subunit